MEKIYSTFDFFSENSLKKGDIFCYSQSTTFCWIYDKARELGGMVEYIPPSDNDYHKTNGMGVRVITPIAPQN